jgi:DNA-binding CsgD family transcriptional regulator
MSSKPALGRQVRPAPKVPVGFKPLQANGVKAARIGLLVLAPSLKPIYCNSEALKILAYPNRPPKTPSAECSKSIRSIVGKNTGADDFVKTSNFVSGRRRYLCRTFILEFESEGGFKPTIAIILERDRGLLRELVDRFQLTDRESEAVQHLTHGLTSKEIAHRMNISANTVKAFLRFIMIKMGVTTRSGIIGKLVSGSYRDDE